MCCVNLFKKSTSILSFSEEEFVASGHISNGQAGLGLQQTKTHVLTLKLTCSRRSSHEVSKSKCR